MKDMIGSAVVAAIYVFLFALYVFGIYTIIVDDHRYTTKDVVIGAVLFPYPWWVGGKEAYRIITVSKDDREFETKCLDTSEAVGLKRKSRLRYCECLVETKNPQACQKKIFIQ